eukprot:g27789.t1
MAPTGAEAVQYGTGEKSCLSQPRGLHVDVDGQLYVADFANFSVVRFGHNDDAAGRVVVGERAIRVQLKIARGILRVEPTQT